MQERLFDWARGAGVGPLRDLPWRRTRDPWAILVAEAMLQQTQVARVVPRWSAFLERFPTPGRCAEAGVGEVVREWAGLGYNRRATMLQRAAVDIVQRHGGRVPEDLASLLALPGVGPYTARAVRVFAFEAPAAPVDTNIGRVLARVQGRRLSPAEAQRLADDLVDEIDPGSVWLWNQALMELGALVCTKRAPACDLCPVAAACRWRGGADGVTDPAVGSAGVNRPQTRFEGSDRQLRGRLVDAARRGPVPVDTLDPASARLLDGLVDDGLVAVDGGVVRLVGDPVSPGR